MDIQKVIEGLDKLFADRQSEKVEDYLSVNLEQALNEGDAGSAITIINELIGFYRDTSQYDKAEAYCEKLLPFMEKAGLHGTVHYGTSCLNIANVYRAAGKLEDSLKHYHMVFDIYEQVLDKKDFRYASLNNNLSLLYQEMGDYEKACEALEQALLIVKETTGAEIELAVTYTNLAASYNRAGRLEQARDAVAKGLAIFEDGRTGDYHYSAALSVAGDVHYADGEYRKAADCYEQAMLALRQHVGLTHAYFRIVSNLQTTYEALGESEALKGLSIARDYYEKFGKTVFDELKEEMQTGNLKAASDIDFTIAKVGEGSECFGFDDILSGDHDFGPGFGVFVTRKQYGHLGNRLEQAYDSLPATFRGFSKPEPLKNMPRNGIIILEDFYKRILNLSDEEFGYLLEHHTLSEDTWLKAEEWQLKTVTNGELFEGEQAVFGSIYTNLKRGYPESVWKRRLAQKLGEICQEGQYNYKRLMQRGDVHGAALILHSFEEHVLELLFLLNRVYAPHKKWMFHEAETLPLGGEILEQVKKLMVMSPALSTYEKRDCIDWIGITNKEDKVQTTIDRIAELIVQQLLEMKLTECKDIYLEEHIPYILR